MIRSFTILIPVAVLLVCGLTDRINSGLSAQQSIKASKPKFKADHIKSTPKIETRGPGYLGTRVYVPEDADQTLAKVITKHFKSAPIPASRLSAYMDFDNPNYQVDGWLVEVKEIESTKEGTIIKVGVWPSLTSRFGASTVASADVSEWYLVDKTGLHLVNTYPPAGEVAETAIFVD